MQTNAVIKDIDVLCSTKHAAVRMAQTDMSSWTSATQLHIPHDKPHAP